MTTDRGRADVSSTAGHWVCRLEGHPDVTTDDLTLDELEMAERASGVPYTLMDPHLSVKVAKALLAVMLVRAKRQGGMPQQQAEDEALAVAGGLRVEKLHHAFTFVPPTTPKDKLRRLLQASEAATPVPPSSAPTSVAG